MMEKLRTASNHVVLKIVLGLILISFTLTGVGNYLIGGSKDYAAKVNGKIISRAELENAFTNERARQQQALGEQFSQLAGNAQYLQQMRQQALAQLIDQRLLENYTQSLHLSVNDEQIKQAIYQVPQFQQDGHFDNKTFNAVLSNLGYTPEQYANALRQSLANRQLVNAVAETDFMLPGETQQLTQLIAQRREARQAVMDVGALSEQQKVTADEIKTYYQQHPQQFLNPEQFRISYIKLDAASLQKQPTPQAVREWYDNHQADYTQPERQRYSVIQVKTADQAQSLLDQLHQGADFANLARQHSEDPISAAKGGDLDWMDQGSIPDELLNAKLTTKGELSGVVKSSVGYLILKLNDLQPAQQQPFASVEAKIAEKVKQEAAITEFYQLQARVNDAASNNNQSLAGAEQVAGVKAVETPWFNRGNLPAEIDFAPIQQQLDSGSLLGSEGQPGNNSSILTVDGDRAFVIRIADHKAESTKPLDEVSEQITATLKREKAHSAAKASVDKIVGELQQGNRSGFEAAGLKFGAVQTFDRNQPSALTQAVFDLAVPKSNQPSYGVSQDAQGNLLILALDKVVPGQLTAEQRQQMVTGMVQNNAQLAFEALLQDLRQKAKISYGNAAEAQ